MVNIASRATQFLAFLYVLACGSAWAATDKGPVERLLPASLSALACERPLQAVDLAKNGLFDAQVDMIRLTPKSTSSKVTIVAARERAISLAKANQQLGYAYGVCEDGSAWVAAFPAPSPLKLDGAIVSLDDSAGRVCMPKTLRVLFAPENRGRSFLVPLQTGFSARLPDARGYASVSCTPRQFESSGQREWALIALGGAKVNAIDVLPPLGLRDKEAFLNWINQKRRAENLPDFNLNEELNSAAVALMQSKVIHHNLEALNRARAQLQKKGIELTGENRVQGKSLAEAAGLLWISPSHRDLLLSPTSDMIGMSVFSDSDHAFVAMLAGRKTQSPVAKK